MLISVEIHWKLPHGDFCERFQDSFSLCFHWPFPITNNVPQSNEKKTTLLIFFENDKSKRNGSWRNSLKTVWNWHCSFYVTFWPNIKVLFKFLYCFWPAIKFLFFLPKKSFFFFFHYHYILFQCSWLRICWVWWYD